MEDSDQLHAYLNDQLDAQARSAFEARMTENPMLAAEVAVMRSAAVALGQEGNLDAERKAAGWARLEAELAQTPQEQDAPKPANDNKKPSWYQAALFAAAAVVAWQVVVVPLLAPPAPDQGFVTASGLKDGPILQIAFGAGVTQAQVTSLLQSVDAQIVNGPSAIGLYTLSFEDAAARDAAQIVLEAPQSGVEQVSRP